MTFQKILQSMILKKAGFKGSVKYFPVDFNPIETNNISDVHNYLMKRTWYKTMLRTIKKIFVVLFTSIANAFNHTKCVL